jgi:hypothetical protein
MYTLSATVTTKPDYPYSQVYDGLEFLKDQIDAMKTPDFRQRPTAQVVLQSWLATKVKLDVAIARWRLRKRDEFIGLRVIRDAASVVQQSLDDMTRIFNSQVSGSLFTEFTVR